MPCLACGGLILPALIAMASRNPFRLFCRIPFTDSVRETPKVFGGFPTHDSENRNSGFGGK